MADAIGLLAAIRLQCPVGLKRPGFSGGSFHWASRETFALKTWAMKTAKRRGLKKARVALAAASR